MTPLIRAVELPDGGRVTFTDDEMVPLWGGEARAYRRLTYTRDSNGSQPGQNLVFEVWEGQIVCVSATLVADFERGIPVQQQDMRGVNLDRIGAYVYGWVGVEKPNPAGGWIRVVGHATAQMQQKKIETTPKTRDLSRLRKAAAAYENAPDKTTTTARVEHVANALVVSIRTAWREIDKCKKAGLIDDE